MKYFLFIFAFMFASCSMKKEYSLMESPYEVSIPEENREKYQQFIINTVSAASYHMSGGDYEDPEDVIESAERIAKKCMAFLF